VNNSSASTFSSAVMILQVSVAFLLSLRNAGPVQVTVVKGEGALYVCVTPAGSDGREGVPGWVCWVKTS